MADNKLIGQDYTTPDLVAKVTGKAKYAEDYRVEGMLFAKLLRQPAPARAGARASTPAPRWRCPASRRSSPPTTCPAPPSARRSAKACRRARRPSAA